jgi:hypothetical protein
VRLLIGVLIGLTVGNFLYQAFGHMDWLVAIERSYFQMSALIAIGLAQFLTKSS